MQIRFDGRRVLVAGGSRGIGRSIAIGFASLGASVSICARGKQALDETAAKIGAKGVQVHAANCDLSNASAISAYIADAASVLGGIDILGTNASGFGYADDEAGWAAGINIDIMATVRASRAAIPHLERQGNGAILNISSISGYGPSARSAPYAAVKAALINYTQSQAIMLAARKVRVNAIAPGSIEFPGGTWEDRRTSNPALYDATLKSIPWGRFGNPEEVANTALFLCSDLASWITGQTVIVDGGQTLS